MSLWPRVALLAALVPPALVRAGGEDLVHTDEHHSVFEIGAQEMEFLPVQIGVMFIGTVAFSVCLEFIVHTIKHRTSEVYHEVIQAILNEIMLLGCISFALFILSDTEAIKGINIAGEPFDKHVFEFLHMAIFFVALTYIFSVITVWLSIHSWAERFSAFESYSVLTQGQVDLDEIGTSDFDGQIGFRGSQCGGDDARLIVRIRQKLDHYNAWRSRAGCWERCVNIKLWGQSRKWLNIVNFNRLRSAFIKRLESKRSRLPELDEIITEMELAGGSFENFQFSRYLRKRLRHEIVDCAEIGATTWINLAFFVGINTIRASYEKKDLEDELEDASGSSYGDDAHRMLGGSSGGNDKEYVRVNLYHDYCFYMTISYMLMFGLGILLHKINTVYKVFVEDVAQMIQQNDILDGEAGKGNIDQALRSQILAATGINEATMDFRKKFWFGRPNLVFLYAKIVIMFSCWTFMLYILVFSKYFEADEDLSVGLNILLSFGIFVPMLVNFFYFIPWCVIKTCIILSTGDGEIDYHLLRRTNAREDKELMKAAKVVQEVEHKEADDIELRGSDLSDLMTLIPFRGAQPQRPQHSQTQALTGDPDSHLAEASVGTSLDAGRAAPESLASSGQPFEQKKEYTGKKNEVLGGKARKGRAPPPPVSRALNAQDTAPRAAQPPPPARAPDAGGFQPPPPVSAAPKGSLAPSEFL